MTLRQLQIFVTIVETGSFIRAAEKLRVAQPSISQQIQQLEDELGEQLLFRMRNRKKFMTEAGEVVKKHADHILHQSEILRMEVTSITQDPMGDFCIGIGGHQLTSMVAPAMSQFHKKFPRIRVDIENATSPKIIDLLKSNNLDIGIVTLPMSDKELRTQVLFSEEMVVVVKKGSLLGNKRYILPADIGNLPLVLYDRTTQTRARIDEFFHDAGITPEVVLELSSVEAMEMMVVAGFGASIIPLSAARALPYRDTLQPLCIRGRPLMRQVGVVISEFSPLPRVIDELYRLIKERFLSLQGNAT